MTSTATPNLPLPVAVYCFSGNNNVFNVSITNNGGAGYVGYSTNGGATITGTHLAFGATELITLPAGTTSLTLYRKLNAGDAWSGPVSTTNLDKENVCEKDPIHLAFFCSGNSSAPDGWTVTNNNPFAVNITWAVTGGGPSSSGPINILPSQSYTFNTSHITGLMQIFVNGALLAQGSEGNCSQPPPSVNLTLSAFCAANPNSYNGWWVTNHGTSDVNFNWKIQGTSLTGTGTVPASATIYFLTSVQSSADVLLLYSNGDLQATVPAITTCSGTPPILIPVTGSDSNPLRHSFPYILASVFFGLLGLGLIVTDLVRKYKK